MTREEAIRKLQKQKAEYLEEWVDYSGVAEAYDMAIEALEQPIIRCKDCKHHEDEQAGMVYCQHVIGGWADEEWFCADAERKEE